MYSYFAYGLHIHSEIELPELLIREGQADVFIQLDPDYAIPLDAQTHPDRWIIYDDSTCIYWTEIGFFNIERSRVITVKPDPLVEKNTLTNFIVTVAMSKLHHQRGLLVLHASAVAIDGKGVAFMGQSGWGKSTLAASLVERGHSLIADDNLVVDFKGDTLAVVYPAFPEIKLWPDSLVSLGETPDSLPLINSAISKRAKHLEGGFADGSLPLARIYVLDRGDESSIQPLPLQEALRELLTHSHFSVLYSDFLYKMRNNAAQQLKNSAKAASLVSVHRLVRRWQLTDLPEIVRLIEADFFA